MCRRRRNGNTLGCLVVLAGVLIILALVLPAGFWWFAVAARARWQTARVPCQI